VLEGLAEDLGLHGLAAEKAFKHADAVLEVTDTADGDDLLVRPDSRLGETPWSRATAETVMPGCMVCSTTLDDRSGDTPAVQTWAQVRKGIQRTAKASSS
jgi:hypothetical protein